MSIFEDGSRLSAEALKQLGSHADMIQCECPIHLIKILTKIRDFASYSQVCVEKFPADAKTHEWLYQSALNLDTLLSGTIAQLARLEGFINEKNEIVNREDK